MEQEIIQTIELTEEQNIQLEEITTLIKDYLLLDDYEEYLDDIKDIYTQAILKGAEIELPEEFEYPNEKELELFADLHINHYTYKARHFAKRFQSGEITSLVIGSCMYGGKTSLAMLIKKELEKEEDQIVIPCISSSMGEDFLTARSMGTNKIFAKKFGPEYYMQLKEDIIKYQQEGKKVTLLLDEFSFLFGKDLEELEQFHLYCKENNINTIYLGLNKGYTGQDLEVFAKQDSIIMQDSAKYSCKAFIPGKDTNLSPTGRFTTRYVRIGGRLILDLGILPLVVSKEKINKKTKKPIVLYSATTKENTITGIFEEQAFEILTKFDYYSSLQKKNVDILVSRNF